VIPSVDRWGAWTLQRRSVGRDGPERLGGIPLFEGLSPGRLRMLAGLVDEVLAEQGEVLMAEGEQGFEMMMIEQGSAVVRQGGDLIDEMHPGDFFGEMAILGDGMPRSATVTALTPVRALLFGAHFVREIRDRLPAIGERIERAAAERAERDRAARAAEHPARA
jgi:CRP/FNR family cyclic AMP-dependent transcriptional regulator